MHDFQEKGSTSPIYRSHFVYDKTALEYSRENSGLKNYTGNRDVDYILIDIDRGDDTNRTCLGRSQALYYELCNLGLKEGNFRVYFSGTGYHFLLHKDNFNFEASPELPYIVKNTMDNLLETEIDLSVYNRTSIYRELGTRNPKSNLFKTHISFKDFPLIDWDDIKRMASKPMEYIKDDNPDNDFKWGWGDGTLKQYIISEVDKTRFKNKVTEPYNVATCIQRLYAKGPQRGKRNNTVLRIASHFRRHGIPSHATKIALLEWNDGSLNDQIIIDKVENTYNNGYQYGCQDHIMKEECYIKCKYYKRKDYMVDVYTSEQLQNEMAHRLGTDYSGQTINLASIFGLEEEDATVYPGELITIFGPTGFNKTTLAQNIVLGYDSNENIIRQEWQIPTLYLSLELSGWFMHRRNLQIVSDSSKSVLNKRFKNIYDTHRNLVDHMVIQTVSPTLEQIEEKIREILPKIVVIDYIDLVDPGKGYRGEYETIRRISHFLSSLAVNMDIIIIQISQVSREYSRAEALDVYAGKGSGAIENASRKVIGIFGKKSSSKRTISLMKNTDGDEFNCDVEWTPSFRLRRITDAYSA